GRCALREAVCCRQGARGCEVCEPCSVAVEYRVGYYEECSHTLCGHRRECAVELGGTSGLQELKLYSQRPSRDGHFSDRERMVRIGRVREDGHMADLGDGLLEQLQLFGDDFQTGAAGHPCDVPARAREARDEPGANRITNGNHDDGDRLGGVPGCRHSLRPLRYDEVHLEPDQLGRQVRQPVDPTLRISIVDDNTLALTPPELAQPLPERAEQGRPIGRGRQPKETYPRPLARCCCPRAASGHAAAPPSSVMNSRLLTWNMGLLPACAIPAMIPANDRALSPARRSQARYLGRGTPTSPAGHRPLQIRWVSSGSEPRKLDRKGPNCA